MTEVVPYSAAPPVLVDAGPVDELARLTAAWLLAQRSPHTRIAYRRGLTGIGATGEPAVMGAPGWLPWCRLHGVDPVAATRGHVDAYRLVLERAGYREQSIGQRLAAVASWYEYLIGEGAVPANPAARATRPVIDKDASPAVGLSQEEARLLLAQADADGPLAAAVTRLLAYTGVRVSVVTDSNVGHLGWEAGRRTLHVRLKGGKTRRIPLAPPVADAVDTYLAGREPAPGEDEPLFVRVGGRRLDESWVRRLVRRLAKQGGVRSWRSLSPHSLRHTFATLALGAGVPLAQVQDGMGHADPRTTRAYDRARNRMENHPTYTLAGLLGDAPTGQA